jgi:hypothetical protein
MTGTDLRPVAELMGHATIQMTMRYSQLAPAQKQAAVDCLGSLGVAMQADSTDTKTSTSRKRRSKKTCEKRGNSLINVPDTSTMGR